MLGGVAGRHMSTRRRGSSPLVRLGVPGDQLEPWSAPPPLQPPASPRYRRRRAVTTSDFKSCALVQTRVKLGDIM
ncbi:Voltage-dependent calcium channel type A subunit alpha-1 [Blattella germanica]|nr:Voltage-dependent calcium channel type A subunit alpha-1 [Blattella germanica]